MRGARAREDPPSGPRLIRTMNERRILADIRRAGALSRADVVGRTGLSRPTVSLALAKLEESGLLRLAGTRTGVPGPPATLYEVDPSAGAVLALDVGEDDVRGGLSDLAGTLLARATLRVGPAATDERVAALRRLAGLLASESGVPLARVTQTVVAMPGVHDTRRRLLGMPDGRPEMREPRVLNELRSAFGDGLLIETDVDAAALAEQAHGHGRGVGTFVYAFFGTGIGMGLVIDGRLHRGVHGAAGEIGYLPLGEPGEDPTAASAAKTARALCAVISVLDPELIVVGGNTDFPPGALEEVRAELALLTPVRPEIRMSELGQDAVVDGALAAGLESAWEGLFEAAQDGE